MNTPTFEPAKITAGDSVSWKRSFSDYPASQGWVASYTLISNTNKYTFTGAASGDDHLMTISAATSAAFVAGMYGVQGVVTKGTERATVFTGNMEVQPNFAALSTLDTRTHVKKTLDAIEAVIVKAASREQEEYEIAGRRLKYIPFGELLALRDTYRKDYSREQNAERIAKGLAPKNRVYVRI